MIGGWLGNSSPLVPDSDRRTIGFDRSDDTIARGCRLEPPAGGLTSHARRAQRDGDRDKSQQVEVRYWQPTVGDRRSDIASKPRGLHFGDPAILMLSPTSVTTVPHDGRTIHTTDGGLWIERGRAVDFAWISWTRWGLGGSTTQTRSPTVPRRPQIHDSTLSPIGRQRTRGSRR